MNWIGQAVGIVNFLFFNWLGWSTTTPSATTLRGDTGGGQSWSCKWSSVHRYSIFTLQNQSRASGNSIFGCFCLDHCSWINVTPYIKSDCWLNEYCVKYCDVSRALIHQNGAERDWRYWLEWFRKVVGGKIILHSCGPDWKRKYQDPYIFVPPSSGVFFLHLGVWYIYYFLSFFYTLLSSGHWQKKWIKVHGGEVKKRRVWKKGLLCVKCSIYIYLYM